MANIRQDETVDKFEAFGLWFGLWLVKLKDDNLIFKGGYSNTIYNYPITKRNENWYFVEDLDEADLRPHHVLHVPCIGENGEQGFTFNQVEQMEDRCNGCDARIPNDMLFLAKMSK
ncbi:MAG: hypothetical protein ACXABY_07180 [Candidatus Thorarchaeota archaeon]|jgi:hypothetical protein